MLMLSRVALVLITLLWVATNVLLWRSEFGPGIRAGSEMPVAVVWQKVLTAPDDSALQIIHHGRKIGFCQWVANVGNEQATGKTPSEDLVPDGLVERLTGYRIDFNGGVAVSDLPNRLRFELTMRFSTNHSWQDLRLRLNLRPNVWEIYSAAASQSLRLKITDAAGQTDRVFPFANLRNPKALLQEFADPLTLGLLGAAGLPATSGTLSSSSLGLTWGARNDWLKIGHSPVRVYRLWARVWDRFQVVVLVSRIGEILRVELPDDLVLINDDLTSL
jgi:hypothetical protein